jgi:hypothetical protein
MSQESNLKELVSAIRSEIDYIKKYESFFLGYNKDLEVINKEFGTKALEDNVSNKEVIDFCLKNYTLKSLYTRDIKILYNRVLDYYKALVLLKGKDLLEEKEIKLLESVNPKLEKINFVFNEKDELTEKTKGFVENIKENIKNSGQLDKILKGIRDSI